jgi:hypothetical protein
MWRQTVVQKCISDGDDTDFLSNLDKNCDKKNLVGHHCFKWFTCIYLERHPKETCVRVLLKFAL